MVSSGLKGFFGACIAGSLMFSSTAALASAPAPQVDPWAVLTAMTAGAPAAAMCGSSAAAAAAAAAATQAPGGCVLPVVDAAPPVASAAPPPPPLVAETGAGISPLLLGLLAVATGVGLYFAVHSGGSHNSVGSSPMPISPT